MRFVRKADLRVAQKADLRVAQRVAQRGALAVAETRVPRQDQPKMVVGASVAVIYDARRSVITANQATLGATGITMHVLPAGSTFDPKTGVATLAH